MLCGGGEIFLPFPFQGDLPRLALPLLRVGGHRPEEAVGPAIRGEASASPGVRVRRSLAVGKP